MKQKEKVQKNTNLKIRYKKSLDKYKDKVLFPEKVARANEILRTVGLPKI
jgi:hypothetical protein